MGLDMYLSVDLYLSHWPHNEGELEYRKATAVIEALNPTVQMYDGGCGVTVKYPVLVWRKANQVHQWFVDNVQDGVDNCQSSEVSLGDLVKLRGQCRLALITRDPSILPPQGGFFFGSTDVDEWYWKDLEYTADGLTTVIEQAQKAVDEGDVMAKYFEYRASW
jgi:hypothetical protein